MELQRGRKEAKWSSGVAVVFWVYYKQMFSKIHLDIATTTEQQYILRSKKDLPSDNVQR